MAELSLRKEARNDENFLLGSYGGGGGGGDGFFLTCEDFGRMFAIHSPPAPFFFFFF